ncbi:MAG: hypothetical protein FJ403_03450 [Verrucomicrobia bacterium]|nr:hypothetical protein [Verrucomicrobiota bacterium]
MSNAFKIGFCVLLAIGAFAFGCLFYTNYNRLMNDSGQPSPSSPDVPALETKKNSGGAQGYARLMTYGGLFFVSLVGLGFFLGREVSQFFGGRVLRGLYNDEGEGMQNPEYDIAEQEWADGNYLEAIRLMREYLQKNPREQHAAIRIAEIYEKDLNNPLAAALEYEEVLKHKLPAERWGWAAIHLCNLYFKLVQTDKAVALLRRIDTEYAETAAANKARKRLALYDSGATEGLIEESPHTNEKPASGRS